MSAGFSRFPLDNGAPHFATEALLIFQDEIRHPEPELAVRWAMLMPGFGLRELLLFDKANLTGRLVPLDDAQLQEELVRVFLGYLGVDSAE